MVGECLGDDPLIEKCRNESIGSNHLSEQPVYRPLAVERGSDLLVVSGSAMIAGNRVTLTGVETVVLSPPESWQSRAEDRRRSCGARHGMFMLVAVS
jgi:hypothetical protein